MTPVRNPHLAIIKAFIAPAARAGRASANDQFLRKTSRCPWQHACVERLIWPARLSAFEFPDRLTPVLLSHFSRRKLNKKFV